MSSYIDGFVFPLPRIHVDTYSQVADSIAQIWKEHGALAYFEYLGEDLDFEGTRTFPDCLDASEDEAIVFGWVLFESRAARDVAHERVAADPRMESLVAPLIDSSKIIFEAKRMAHGGFKALVEAS